MILGITKPLRMTGSEFAAADMDPRREKAEDVEEKDDDRLTPAILEE